MRDQFGRNELGPQILNDLHPELGTIWISHLRRALLEILAASPCYTAPVEFLKDAVRLFGLATAGETLLQELRWLAEQQLVEISIREQTVIELKAAGLDVGAGLREVGGISRRQLPG